MTIWWIWWHSGNSKDDEEKLGGRMRREMMIAAQEAGKGRLPSQKGAVRSGLGSSSPSSSNLTIREVWGGRTPCKTWRGWWAVWVDVHLRDLCSTFCFGKSDFHFSSTIAPQRPLLMECNTTHWLSLLLHGFGYISHWSHWSHWSPHDKVVYYWP